jgi:hypothetical protein
MEQVRKRAESQRVWTHIFFSKTVSGGIWASESRWKPSRALGVMPTMKCHSKSIQRLAMTYAVLLAQHTTRSPQQRVVPRNHGSTTSPVSHLALPTPHPTKHKTDTGPSKQAPIFSSTHSSPTRQFNKRSLPKVRDPISIPPDLAYLPSKTQ